MQAATFQRYGTKSEVYTFGIILWQLCSHKRPGVPLVPAHVHPETKKQVLTYFHPDILL